MQHSFARYPAPQKLSCSRLDGLIGQTEPSPLKDDAAPRRARMRAESQHCLLTVDTPDGKSSLTASIT